MGLARSSTVKRIERLESVGIEAPATALCLVCLPPGPAGYLASSVSVEAWQAFEAEYGAEAAEAARRYAETEDPLLCQRIVIRQGFENIHLAPGEELEL
jgi:hypothetical protein